MMQRYMIETPHEAKECDRLVQDIYAAGYIHNFDWGCKDGVHCGWAVIEAESEEQAKGAVPVLVRGKARVTEVLKYTPEQEKELHRG